MDRTHLVGNIPITLPKGHALDGYQRAYLNYDKKISIIASLVANKYPDSFVVDIGANVGDTAAAIRSQVSLPIICIEGSHEFLPYLKKNIERMPGINVLIPKFIGFDGMGGAYRLAVNKGTAHLESDMSGGIGRDGFIGFDQVLSDFKNYGEVKLVKSDTDGFDFSILSSAMMVLSVSRPTLFFEFDHLIGRTAAEVVRQLAIKLVSAGYAYCIVYDNYGNYLFSSLLSSDVFDDLMASLAQGRAAGGGVSYFDVCCFSSDDEDLFRQMINFERKILSV